MKKALLVLGFALCASFAFAQTSVALPTKGDCMQTVAAPQAKSVDYKASLFMKDDTILRAFNFASNDMAGIIKGADGHVQATDLVWRYDADGNLTIADTLQAHGQAGAISNWQRVDNVAAVTSAPYNGLPYLNYVQTYMAEDVVGDDNGFMFMTLRATLGTGVHNAYFQLPGVDPAGSDVIDIAFNQFYVKYYDQCFIDYKIGDKWVAREINVTGVDISVNYIATSAPLFTMPLALAGENMVNVRFRYYSSGQRGNSYGYMWAVDNVTIIGGEADRWYTNDQKFLDGGYGTMPAGMSIPLSWYGVAYNNGANPRNNVTLTMEHFGADRATSDIVITDNQANMPANPTAAVYSIIDERGFISGQIDADPSFVVPDDYDMLGWWWSAPNYQAENVSGSFGLRGLPTSTVGLNYVAAHLSSTGADPAEWDTIAYNVVESTGGEGTSLAVEGYRWGRDNGIIPSNSIYSYGFVWDEDDQNWYITDDGNYDHEGYMVWVRYTTGNDIPEGWVFRGVEIIPNTTTAIEDMALTPIFPVLRKGVPSEQGVDYMSFEEVETGFSASVPYEVQESDLNILPTGYINTNDPDQSYNAVNLRFYSQPVLEPNTSYYIGYQMAGNGKFSAAATRRSYATTAGGETTLSYYRDEDLHNYYWQFYPSNYDVYVYDPDRASTIFASAYDEWTPLIRPIVGAPATIETRVINAECGTGVTIESEAGDTICNGSVTTYVGGGASVYIVPEGSFSPEYWSANDTATGCYIIDDIIVDDNVIDLEHQPAGIDVSEGFRIVYDADSSTIMQRRFYYAVSFANIQGNHVVRATAHWEVFHPENSIDPMALNVSLGLQPNPATSNVRLNVQGVSGVLNCSIIDMSGRVIYNANINAGEPTNIDLSGVAAGAYFVRITNDKFSKVEKRIVR